MSERKCIAFSVPAVPVAQPRQRHALIAGHVRNYTPTKSPVNEYKATLRLAASQAYSGPPLQGPLVAVIVFVFPSKTKRSRKPKATRPDCDNLAKATLDALNSLLYGDDSQIVSLRVEKWHASGDEQPHVNVLIHEWAAV